MMPSRSPQEPLGTGLDRTNESAMSDRDPFLGEEPRLARVPQELAMLLRKCDDLEQFQRSLRARSAQGVLSYGVFTKPGSEEPNDSEDPTQDRVTIDPIFPLTTDDNFYDVQFNSRGRPYRWTGPDRSFTFRVTISRKNDGYFSLYYTRFFVEAPASALQCLLDGHPVELTHTKIAEKFKAQGFMPACPTVNRATLTFICPGVASPAETIGSRDQRRLGLAFRQLRLDTGKAAEIDGAFLRREGSATSNGDGAPEICGSSEPGPDETP